MIVMRLIDAKRLEANIKEAFRENPVVMGIMLRWIRKQPTAADVAPVVHGRFVYGGPRLDWWYCSNCGKLASGVETRFDYCPWRGAKMDGGNEDAESID